MELDDTIQQRQSIRRYSSKQFPFEIITRILDAARQAPMAGNIYTLKFIIVEDVEKKNQIAEASAQEFIAAAPYLIVVCSKNDQIIRSYEERGLKYSKQQAGAAIENMILKITDLGLSSCWIGAFDDFAVKRILNVPDDVEVEAILPVAYHLKFAAEPRKKKPELKNLIFFEKYGQTVKKVAKKPEAK